jgi:hypothetical protein
MVTSAVSSRNACLVSRHTYLYLSEKIQLASSLSSPPQRLMESLSLEQVITLYRVSYSMANLL